MSVAADIFDGSCDQSGGPWDDAGYNAGADASCENGGTGDSAALTPAELGPLASNGGPTQTVLPLAGNPALGIVPDPTSVTLGGGTVALCPVTDQRGVASAPDAACDAGAVQVTPELPAVTRVSPAAGPVTGGTPITITGTNFTPGATVELGQGPSAIMATGVDVVSPTEITATTGGPAKSGKWNVFVLTSGGTSKASSGDVYRYMLRPSVTSLSPGQGSPAGGTKVTIRSSNFTTLGATVSFGAESRRARHLHLARRADRHRAGRLGHREHDGHHPGGTSSTGTGDHYRYIPSPADASKNQRQLTGRAEPRGQAGQSLPQAGDRDLQECLPHRQRPLRRRRPGHRRPRSPAPERDHRADQLTRRGN